MIFTPDKIKQLPNLPCAAKSMSDYFDPEDCVDCILVRRGYIDTTETRGRLWMIMIASKLSGSLNLMTFTKSHEFGQDKWNREEDISSGGFSNFVREYILN